MTRPSHVKYRLFIHSFTYTIYQSYTKLSSLNKPHMEARVEWLRHINRIKRRFYWRSRIQHTYCIINALSWASYFFYAAKIEALICGLTIHVRSVNLPVVLHLKPWIMNRSTLVRASHITLSLHSQLRDILGKC